MLTVLIRDFDRGYVGALFDLVSRVSKVSSGKDNRLSRGYSVDFLSPKSF